VASVEEMRYQARDIIEQTIAFWRERTGQEYSQEDARQMVANVTGFFQVLTEWEQQAKEENLETKLLGGFNHDDSI
jgi:hypothetical protein